MKGWISVHRKLMKNPVWQDPNYLKLWMYCLLKATHTEHDQLLGSQVVKLEPGQFVTGRTSLADDMNEGMKPKQKQSEISWWRYLNNLEKWGMLNINKTNKYSVVSIVNWDEYQDSEHQVNNKRTTNEHQLNTNNNGNNVNNENKKPSRPKQVYDKDSVHYKLAERLYQKILVNNPEHKGPNLNNWANDVRLMIERDNRTEEQIKYLIDWVQDDSFWKTNILSTSKLREKFDQLVIRVKEEKTKKEHNGIPDRKEFDLDD